MSVLPIGPYAPVAPVAPVKPVARKSKSAERASADRSGAAPARTATALASHSTRAALDEMKLGG